MARKSSIHFVETRPQDYPWDLSKSTLRNVRFAARHSSRATLQMPDRLGDRFGAISTYPQLDQLRPQFAAFDAKNGAKWPEVLAASTCRPSLLQPTAAQQEMLAIRSLAASKARLLDEGLSGGGLGDSGGVGHKDEGHDRMEQSSVQSFDSDDLGAYKTHFLPDVYGHVPVLTGTDWDYGDQTQAWHRPPKTLGQKMTDAEVHAHLRGVALYRKAMASSDGLQLGDYTSFFPRRASNGSGIDVDQRYVLAGQSEIPPELQVDDAEEERKREQEEKEAKQTAAKALLEEQEGKQNLDKLISAITLMRLPAFASAMIPPGERMVTDVSKIAKILSFCTALKGAKSDLHREVARCAHCAFFAHGEVIIAEGQPSEAFYIILAGSVRAYQSALEETKVVKGGAKLDEKGVPRSACPTEDGGQVLGILNPGEGFGELGLILDKPRVVSVAVLSRSGCVLLVIDKEDYLEHVRQFHVLTNRYHDRYVF